MGSRSPLMHLYLSHAWTHNLLYLTTPQSENKTNVILYIASSVQNFCRRCTTGFGVSMMCAQILKHNIEWDEDIFPRADSMGDSQLFHFAKCVWDVLANCRKGHKAPFPRDSAIVRPVSCALELSLHSFGVYSRDIDDFLPRDLCQYFHS